MSSTAENVSFSVGPIDEGYAYLIIRFYELSSALIAD